MGIKIIRAETEHLEQIAPLFDKYRVFYGQKSNLKESRLFIRERFRKKDSVIFFAIADSKSIGYIQLFPSLSSVEMQRVWILNDIYVLPEYRKKKVGKLLMQKAKDFAKSTKAKRIILCTAADNKKAQSLYKSVGYKKDPFIYYRLESFK